MSMSRLHKTNTRACSALKASWCEKEALIELLWRVVDRRTWRGSDLGKSVVCRQVRKPGFLRPFELFAEVVMAMDPHT
jgi:hypothetical protein